RGHLHSSPCESEASTPFTPCLRSVRSCPRVQHTSSTLTCGHLVSGCLDPVHKLTLAIRLPEIQRKPTLLSHGGTAILDIREGFVAVDGRITHAQQVEVWSVQHIDRGHAHSFMVLVVDGIY